MIETATLTWWEYALIVVSVLLLDLAFLIAMGWGLMRWLKKRRNR